MEWSTVFPARSTMYTICEEIRVDFKEIPCPRIFCLSSSSFPAAESVPLDAESTELPVGDFAFGDTRFRSSLAQLSSELSRSSAGGGCGASFVCECLHNRRQQRRILILIAKHGCHRWWAGVRQFWPTIWGIGMPSMPRIWPFLKTQSSAGLPVGFVNASLLRTFAELAYSAIDSDGRTNCYLDGWFSATCDSDISEQTWSYYEDYFGLVFKLLNYFTWNITFIYILFYY